MGRGIDTLWEILDIHYNNSEIVAKIRRVFFIEKPLFDKQPYFSNNCSLLKISLKR